MRLPGSLSKTSLYKRLSTRWTIWSPRQAPEEIPSKDCSRGRGNPALRLASRHGAVAIKVSDDECGNFRQYKQYNRSTIKRLHGPARERFRTLIEEWWMSHMEMNLMGQLHLQKYTTTRSGQSKEILQYLNRPQSFYRIEQTVEKILEQTPLHLLSDLHASAKSANF